MSKEVTYRCTANQEHIFVKVWGEDDTIQVVYGCQCGGSLALFSTKDV